MDAAATGPASSPPLAVTRRALIGTLQAALESIDAVDAAWEGGSASFDREDEWSDVDAVAVVADDAVASTFERVERALHALSPVALRYDVPNTAGYTQRFYRLRDAGEFLVVDLVLMRRSDPLLFREVELHGSGRTWFDRRGVLTEAHLDLVQDLEAARARVPVLHAVFEMFQHLIVKECRRGRSTDALAFYRAFTLAPLAEALRLLHQPERRVFGLRYLARDLPPPVVARLEALSFVRDLDHLGRAHEEARQWFGRCIARLREHGPGAGIE
jgi:predicted nucleotidyltransferase